MGPMCDEALKKQRQIMVLLEDLFEQEENLCHKGPCELVVPWRQVHKVFSHHFAIASKKRNIIKLLVDDNGNTVEGNDDLSTLITNNFSAFFTVEVHIVDEEVLNKIKPRVNSVMNDQLLVPFTAEEVRNALFDIYDFKALGHDGLHAEFYKRFWLTL